MYFILSTDNDISGNSTNIMARLMFVKDITGVAPSPWTIYELSNKSRSFLLCRTEDGFNGVYITAHNFEVAALCSNGVLQNFDFIIANTCVYREELDTDILKASRRYNKGVELWYAKQQVEMTEDHVFRKTNTIADVGTFGFMTSKSDRLMYRNRNKGFMNALKLSFDKVSILYGV